ADVAPGGGLSIGSVTSFGEDARGELYVTDHGSGAADGEVFNHVPGSCAGRGTSPRAPDTSPRLTASKARGGWTMRSELIAAIALAVLRCSSPRSASSSPRPA